MEVENRSGKASGAHSAEPNVTRRGFLAGSGLLAASVAAAGLVGCASPKQGQSGDGASNEKKKAASETIETEVLVVGLGASGILAAYGAASKGAKVIGIDIAESMSGVTNVRTSGSWAVGSTLEKEGPSPYTIQEAMDFVNGKTNYQSNQKALRAIMEAGGRAIDALSSAGMKWRTNFDLPANDENFANRGIHWYDLKGDDRAAVFSSLLDTAGVECMFGTTAESAIMENGKLVGIQCTSDSKVVDIKAAAIVMATGGFLGSPEMVARYFAGGSIVAMGNPVCTGTGINISIDAGAQVGKTFSISANEYGGSNLKATPQYAFRPNTGTNDALRLPVFGGLLVDAEGNRFINEGFACERAMFAGDTFIREKYCYAVADQTFIDRLSNEPVSDFYGDERMKGMFEGIVMSDFEAQFDKAVEEGWAFKADTVEELSEHFGQTKLAETVAEYNGYCEKGIDELFFKDAKYLQPLVQGPYYIVQSQAGGWCSLGGIKTNASCQALDADDKPVDSLFICGVDADIYTSPLYLMACENGFAIASGLIAGESAAEYVKA